MSDAKIPLLQPILERGTATRPEVRPPGPVSDAGLDRGPSLAPACAECGDTGWRERTYDGAPVQCVFCDRMPALLRRQA